MRRLVLIGLIILVAWQWYGKDHGRGLTSSEGATATAATDATTSRAMRNDDPPQAANFKCDGRTHCSQMTSCAEATYFLRNCPDTKMDGDHDGIPCEQQWCGR